MILDAGINKGYVLIASNSADLKVALGLTYGLEFNNNPNPNSLFVVESALSSQASSQALHFWNKLNRFKNPNWQEADQLAIIQVQPRSWAKDYLEQIQPMVRAGLELGIESRFQPLDHAAS